MNYTLLLKNFWNWFLKTILNEQNSFLLPPKLYWKLWCDNSEVGILQVICLLMILLAVDVTFPKNMLSWNVFARSVQTVNKVMCLLTSPDLLITKFSHRLQWTLFQFHHSASVSTRRIFWRLDIQVPHWCKITKVVWFKWQYKLCSNLKVWGMFEKKSLFK